MAEEIRPLKPHGTAAVRQWFVTAIPLDWSGWSLAAGVRAATAVAVPVMIGELTGIRAFSWIAIVAFWGCLVDSGGAWRERFAAMGSFTVLASVVSLAALVAVDHIWAAVTLALVWGFAVSILRIYGSVQSTVGLLLVTDMLVNLGIPAAGWHDIVDRAGLTLVGGGWAMLLVLVIWRLHPYGPARRSVAACWNAVAHYADALAKLHRSGAHAGDWPVVIRDRRRAARDAIEASRKLVARDRRSKAGESSRSQLILVLLADADRAFEDLIALSELLELDWDLSPIAVQRAVRVALHRLGKQAHYIEHVLTERKRVTIKHPTSGIKALQRGGATNMPGALPAIIRLINDMADYLEGAVEMAGGVRAPRSLAEAIADRPSGPLFDRGQILSTLRANLKFESVAFRHALRLAVTAGFGEWIVLRADLPRGYWLTITAVVILQPFMATTWRRTLERTGATVLGGLIAAGIGLIVHQPIVVALLVFPLSVASMAVRGVNYALFVFCLTPQFVLIAELFQTGAVGDWHLAGLRSLDTLLGGLLGLAAGFTLWPTWEAPHLPKYLAAAIDGTRAYLEAAMALDRDADSVQEARRGAGLTSNNAEASLQRLMGEPRHVAPDVIEPAMMIVTCLRRMGGMAAAVNAAGLGRARDPSFVAMTAWLSSALRSVSIAVADRTAPTALTELPRTILEGEDLVARELARSYRQVVVLHSAAERLARL